MNASLGPRALRKRIKLFDVWWARGVAGGLGGWEFLGRELGFLILGGGLGGVVEREL